MFRIKNLLIFIVMALKNKTLLQELHYIEDKWPGDKASRYGETIESWRPWSYLVDSAVKGEIFLPEKFDELIERVGGKRLYYPNRLSEADSQELYDFNEIVGGLRGASLVENPVTSTVLYAPLCVVFVAAANKLARLKLTRREFLLFSGALVASKGIYAAGNNLLTYKNEINENRKDVEYVQDKIERFGRQ